MLELVTWDDAHFELDPPEEGYSQTYPCQTVGWVIEDGEWLRIESEHTPDGPRAITSVKKSWVSSRTPLAEAHPLGLL